MLTEACSDLKQTAAGYFEGARAIVERDELDAQMAVLMQVKSEVLSTLDATLHMLPRNEKGDRAAARVQAAMWSLRDSPARAQHLQAVVEAVMSGPREDWIDNILAAKRAYVAAFEDTPEQKRDGSQ